MKLQPGNTGLTNLNKPVDIVSYEENNIHPEDSFYYVDLDKLNKELQFKYVKDLIDSPKTFSDALDNYHSDIIDYDEPDSYKNITLKELIEDFRLWFEVNTTD
jgi:hypothetical protein